MTEVTREDIFDQDRKERQKYMQASIDEDIYLPLTKDGFEALLEITAKLHDLPVDDNMRMVVAGYVHHIENEVNTITLKQLSKVMYKSVSNSTTWRIDQEIKLKAREAAQAKAKELAENVTNINNNAEVQ